MTCISRSVFPREVLCSTIAKKCMAVKLALDSLKYYLLGREFIVETDHKALQWLERMKDTSSRITQLYLAMQPFRSVVRYVPGKANATTDFLSRCVSEAPEEGGSVTADDVPTQ